MRKQLLCFYFFACCAMLSAQDINPIQEAMANYDYETALLLISKEKATIPLLYQKGKALKGLGDNYKALTVFREVVLQDSLNPRAYIETAECCKSLARYNEALEYYQNALKLNPDNKYVHLQYISLLMGMKRYHDSFQESDLLVMKDSSAFILHLRAESMERISNNSNVDRVIEAYQDIQRRYPEDYLSAAKLGNIYITGQQLEDAINITEKYRMIDSTNVLVNRVNAQAYCLNKDYTTAIQRYEQLLQKKDSTFQTCFYAGISYYAIGDFYSAHDLLEHALKEDRTNVNVLYYLGRACSKTSWKKEGVAYLEQAIALSLPNDSTMIRLYVGLADGYKMTFQYKEQANTLIEQYKKYDTNNHKLLYNAAYIYYYWLKDTDRTEQCLEAYLKTRTKNKKEDQQEVDSNGIPLLGEENRYNAADNWLEDIRERRKREDFFKGKVDTASVVPVR